jgi:DNA-binding response OmpR family regulator
MMLTGLKVLVVEDEILIALGIEDALVEAGALVLGPVRRVSEALTILKRQVVQGAILDANLLDRDISPVLTNLIRRNRPLLLYSGTGVPEEVRHLREMIPVLAKPAPMEDLISAFTQIVGRVEEVFTDRDPRSPTRRTRKSKTFH